MVRNPWEWYVSWYCYMQARGPELMAKRATTATKAKKQAMWTDTFGSGQASFREVVVKACRGDVASAHAQRIRETGTDLYSSYVWGLTEQGVEHDVLTGLRFESLRSSAETFLEAHDLLTDPVSRALREHARVNSSHHGEYREYYDQQLRELVGEHARRLVDKHEYTF